MKGKILSSILALGASFAVFANGSYMATAPMASEPEYFNGWVVGIDGSAQHLTGSVKDVPFYSGTVEATEPPSPIVLEYTWQSSGETSLNTDIGDTTAGGGLFAGYGKVLNNSKFYLGGEAYIRYAHNVTHTTTTQDSVFEAKAFLDQTLVGSGSLPFDERSSVDVKSDWSYGAALKFGYLVTPKTMIYLLAGAEYSKFKVDASHNAPNIELGNSAANIVNVTDSYSFDENRTAFVPGIGIETMLTDKLSLKAEYTYADYGEFGSHDHDATFPISANNIEGSGINTSGTVDTHSEDKVSLKRGLFSLGLAYHFNGI